jgi:hypothetical protein
VRRIKPGDLIVWTLITFSGDLPYNYSELWGISEDLLLSGEYGEIIYQE